MPNRRGAASSDLSEPFIGWIDTTLDALLVLEAALRGVIPRVKRRLDESERSMVRSGAIFVFDEVESGVKRWTDGRIWSASRGLGNFLLYREQEKRYGRHDTSTPEGSNAADSPAVQTKKRRNTKKRSRPFAEGENFDAVFGNNVALRTTLVGSLSNNYKFKPGGLMKKTFSFCVEDAFSHHIVSYYTLEDVIAGRLRSVSSLPEMRSLEISPMYMANLGRALSQPSEVDLYNGSDISESDRGYIAYEGEYDPTLHTKEGRKRKERSPSEDGSGENADYDADDRPRKRTRSSYNDESRTRRRPPRPDERDRPQYWPGPDQHRPPVYPYYGHPVAYMAMPYPHPGMPPPMGYHMYSAYPYGYPPPPFPPAHDPRYPYPGPDLQAAMGPREPGPPSHAYHPDPRAPLANGGPSRDMRQRSVSTDQEDEDHQHEAADD